MKWSWSPKKPLVLILEVEKGARVPGLDKDSAQAVASLQGHPGFLYLLAKLKFQNEVLKSTLQSRRHENIREVEFLQSGIAWTNWLRDQLEGAVNFKTAPVTDASASEQTIFEESQRMLQILK